MQHSVLDIMLYLFDYMVYEKNHILNTEDMRQNLSDAGFADEEITRALDWYQELTKTPRGLKKPQLSSIRLYTNEEMRKISVEARSFLYQLEKIGVIDSGLREVIVDKVMALDEDYLLLDDIKWIVLMSIFNQPDKAEALVWLEKMIVSNGSEMHAN